MKNIIGFLAVIAGITFSSVAVYNNGLSQIEHLIGMLVGMGVALIGSLFINGSTQLIIATMMIGVSVIALYIYGAAVMAFPPSIMGFLLAAGSIGCLVRYSFDWHKAIL